MKTCIILWPEIGKPSETGKVIFPLVFMQNIGISLNKKAVEVIDDDTKEVIGHTCMGSYRFEKNDVSIEVDIDTETEKIGDKNYKFCPYISILLKNNGGKIENIILEKENGVLLVNEKVNFSVEQIDFFNLPKELKRIKEKKDVL